MSESLFLFGPKNYGISGQFYKKLIYYKGGTMSQEEYQKAFEDAKTKYRQHGAGGVSLPGTDNATPTEIPVVDPSKNIVVKGGVVYIGGPNLKITSKQTNSSIKVFDYGQPTKKDEKS